MTESADPKSGADESITSGKATTGTTATTVTPPPKPVVIGTTTTTNYALVAGHCIIWGLWIATQYVYIPYPVHLLTLVTAILYVSCHQSIFLAPEIHEKLPFALSEGDSSDSNSTTRREPRETLRKEDAYQFPLVGSCALFGLYLAFRYLDKEWVNFLMGVYFSGAGLVAVTVTLNTYIERVLVVKNHKFRRDWTISHSMPDWVAGPSPAEFVLEIHVSHMVSLPLAMGIIALYFNTQRAWFLNNVLGISFCLQGVRNFSVGSFQIAAILLIGLFFYDIFWVFGTEVMVKVATNLDGPIKLLLPRDSLEKDPETGKLNLSLLGLGDIVIPGFFLALMLRFDFHLWSMQQGPAASYNPIHAEHVSFPKPYFHSTLLGYVAGLGTTLWVMFQFKAAQPALLYLVPACLGTAFGCAVARGEVKALMEYTEEEAEEEEDPDAGNKEQLDTPSAEKNEESKKDD